MRGLNYLRGRSDICQNCMLKVNEACSGHKRNIVKCPDYFPLKTLPEKATVLEEDEEITS